MYTHLRHSDGSIHFHLHVAPSELSPGAARRARRRLLHLADRLREEVAPAPDAPEPVPDPPSRRPSRERETES